MLKKEDNFVPSFLKQVIYCASGWQGVLTEKVLKYVWYSCCRQNLNISNFKYLHRPFHKSRPCTWRKAPSNKLVKSEIELWFCCIRQSSVIVSRRVKPDLSKCRFGQRDGSRAGQMGCRVKASHYTHKLCYPSERHDDVLPLVLEFHGQRASRDFQHPPKHQLQFWDRLSPAGGFSIQASVILKCTQSFVSIPRSPICPLIHVLSHSPHSFPNRHLSFPFTKQNYSPFPTV